jgi:hypothetical protein
MLRGFCLAGTYRRLLLAAVVATGAPSNALADSTAARLANVPVPSGTRVLSVGGNTIHNGSIVSMATYESSLSLSHTADFFRDLWQETARDGVPGFVETRAGDWLMLSRLHEGFNTVLQLDLAEPHRSKGFLSVMALDSTAPGTTPLQGLDGFEQLSTTRSFDGTRESVLSVYAAAESVDTLVRQLADYWQRRDWTLVSEESHAQSKVLLLNRQSALMEIVISSVSAVGSFIVINEVSDRA